MTIYHLRERGETVSKIAEAYGLTKQRVSQIYHHTVAELTRIEAERKNSDAAFLGLTNGARQDGQVAQAGGANGTNGAAPGDVLANELVGVGANGQQGGAA